MLVDTVVCPLCHNPHPLLTARNGNRFVFCGPWGQRLYFNQGEPQEYLNKTLGATTPKEKTRRGDLFP